jgi:hypothetical protein
MGRPIPLDSFKDEVGFFLVRKTLIFLFLGAISNFTRISPYLSTIVPFAQLVVLKMGYIWRDIRNRDNILMITERRG